MPQFRPKTVIFALFTALFLPFVAILPGAATATLAENPDTTLTESLAALRAADMRLAIIHHRLARANRALCDRTVARTGLVLHALATYQPPYRAAAKAYFGFATPVAVEGVIADSPAARAGFMANDSIALIAGLPVDIPAGSATAIIAAVEDRIAALATAQPAGAPIAIGIVRNGANASILLGTEPGCAGHIEVGVSRVLNAATDGTTIQINSALMNLLPNDDDLAAVVAHELAHVVLHHQERLTAAKVSRGLLRDFGRNARLIRQTETEADRLSVYLLTNAGYDPARTSQYLKRYSGPLHLNSILAGKTHLRGKERIKLIDAEAAIIAPLPERPIMPPWLNTRAMPLQ